MTAIASAVQQAPGAPPHPAPRRTGGEETQGFSAALDALAAGEGKARSTDDGKHATDDQADAASTQPSSDLRAALIGGALASLAAQPAAAAFVARGTPVEGGAGGAVVEYAARKTASASGVASVGPEAGAPVTAGGTPPQARAAVGAKLTGERAYLAPAAFQTLTGVVPEAPTAGVAASPSTGAASRTPVPAPGAVATAGDGRPKSTIAERTMAAAPTDPRDPTSEAGSHSDPLEMTPSTDAKASRPAAAAASEPRPASPTGSGTALRAAPFPLRVSGSKPAAASGSFGSGADRPSAPAKGNFDPELDRGRADRLEPRTAVASVAPTTQAEASSFGAAPRQTVFSLSDPSAARPAEALPQTGPPAASTAPRGDKVREIDLDLASSGLKDVTMTVRLTGDKLGVVVRAASGETAATIEGARDAIAERLAAIGQPVTSLIIKETGASDAKGATGQSTGEGEGGAPQEGRGEADDPRGARRGASRF